MWSRRRQRRLQAMLRAEKMWQSQLLPSVAQGQRRKGARLLRRAMRLMLLLEAMPSA